MTSPTPDICDVVVIGAGIVGAAIARDARPAPACRWPSSRPATTSATAPARPTPRILHTGFDATPGTLESRLVARGYDLLGDYAEQTGIPDRADRRAARRLDR